MGTDTPPTKQQPASSSPLADSLRRRMLPALVLVDGRGVPTLTPEAERMMGFDDVQSVASADDCRQALLRALAEEALRAETGPTRRTLEFSPGNRPPLRLQVNAIRLPGEQSGTILVLTDLSDTQEMEQHLVQADRLANIGAISASMAHEIRNALVACRTFVDLLLEKHQDNELAGIVRRELRRIDEIVSRILKHSSTATGKTGPLHVHEVLESSLQLLQPQFGEKSIVVERLFEAAPDLLEGDENQLQQAFMNLLLNSLEAMPFGGTVRIETTCAPARPGTPAGVCVTIADNGAGIPPENLARLFEPFFTTKPGGTGLGLAITHRIINEHRGRITVDSLVGRGSSFKVLLPV